MTLILRNSMLVLPSGLQHGGVVVRDGLIAGVFSDDETPAGFGNEELIDLDRAYLAPGLIDIHIHGSVGVDVQATDEAGLAKLSEFLLSEGVTGYLATFVPTHELGYTKAIATIRSYLSQQNETSATKGRARILGIHFEGPFVSEVRCGALQREHFRTYDGNSQSIQVFTRDEQPELKLTRLMTLAPEI